MTRRLRREEYTVGWVCALPIELAAAVEMLDEEHEDLPQDSNDSNLYTFGRAGDHNVRHRMSTGRPDRYQLCGRGRDADEVKFCIDPVWPTSRYRRRSPKCWVRYKTRRCGDQPTVRAAWRN